MSFPTGLDNLLENYQGTDEVDVVDHAKMHNDVNAAVNDLQVKVGIDNSADTSSLDYKITHLTTASVTDSTDKRYVSDAQLTVIGNTSGTNTGDQDLSGLMVKANNLSDLTNAGTARTNLGVAIGTNVQAFNQNLADLAALTDPNADRLLFWDDSAGAYKHLTLGTNLSITNTTIDASGSGGVAWGDITGTLSAQTDLQDALDDKENTANKATDFSTINDTLYPTVKAVNDAINTAVIGLLDYRGSYDASTNLFPATGGSGVLGAILKGDFWICSVAGTLGTVAVTAGDLIIALQDTPGQTAGNWDLISNELGYTPENSANKVTSISGASTDTQYPSAKLLYDQLALKQPLDADLTTIAGLTATTDNFIVSVSSAWASRTPSQVRTTLGLVIGTDVQAYDADLTTWAGITPGTGVGTALAINVGSAGAFVTFNGALGTPSSGTVTNLTGTASININGTVGATTPTTIVGTTIQANTGFLPDADGGAYLGQPTQAFSHLYLDTTGTINFDNGNVVMTHSSGILTMGTGELRVTNAGTNTASVVTVGGTQTLTAKTLTTPVINGTITGTGQDTAATASTIAMRDANANITTNNWIGGYTTTVTAAGTTTLTVGSTFLQFFTGSTTQTVKLPVASTLTLGHQFEFYNLSSGLVTINSSGNNAVLVMVGSTSAIITCILTSGTDALSWSVDYGGAVPASGKKLTISNTLTFTGTDASSVAFGTGGTVAYTNVTTLSSLALPESQITFTDITTGDASTTKHGFLKKLDNSATNFLNGQGNWAVPAGSGAASADIQTFSSGASNWTKPANAKIVRVQLWAGGGSGAKGSTSAGASGGGGGAYREHWYLASALGSTEAYSVGAGGISQTSANSAGNVGGNSTFGSAGTLVTVYGGGGGKNGDTSAFFGGGGGGWTSAGSDGTTGAGGGPFGGTSSAGVAGATSLYGGGSGGSGATSAAVGKGGAGFFGGAGGGGAGTATVIGGAGGDAEWGGAGGGGDSYDSSPGAGAGGTSKYGGNGGAGAFDANNATDGTAPGGGGGGAETGNSGAGGAGKIVVTTFF